MNIKILDSWLRDFLQTGATAKQIADHLSLASASVERLEKRGDDYLYNIEITTNRPDLMSVVGLAREAAAVLTTEYRSRADTKFKEPKFVKHTSNAPVNIQIVNDAKLVNRICAVALEINLGPSPKYIVERLEASDIRSLNNVVDVTNYVMREIGHPMHVFDYDKLLKTNKVIIRESRAGEKIVTLDGKEYTLAGGDIVADDGTGKIIDLLGVMGTLNSVVDDNTKRVMLFIDNNDQNRIRKTSMGLGIRSEAAILNEKGVDPELAYGAILRGIELLKHAAGGKVISEVVDIYPNKPKAVKVSVAEEKINSTIGVHIPVKTSEQILASLGFEISVTGNEISAKVPSWRANDVTVAEDLVEEVARVYGYQRLPSILPQSSGIEPYSQAVDNFLWERKARDALKYWGFTEVYTYPMVSEDLFEGPIEQAVTIKNPLTEDRVHMRRTIVPSLLEAVRENKNREELKLFEISNVYLKRKGNLPEEKLKLAGVLKAPKISFFDAKGIVEGLLYDMGIKEVEFKSSSSGTVGAGVYIKKDFLGEIEVLERDLIDFELDFETILGYATFKKIYKPISKYPKAIEDLRFEIDETVPYEKIVRTIKNQSDLVKDVSLLDVYKNKKTFRIIYQSYEKNLTGEEIAQIREKIISALKKSFKALLT